MAATKASWSDCYGANLSVRREVLLEIGGFDADFPTAQDTEIAFRLYCHGCQPTYLAKAHGIHNDQKRHRQMLADSRRIGADSLRLIAKHPETLPRRLGGFGKPRPRDVALRRVLIAIRFPPGLLAWLGNLIRGGDRRQVWFHFVSRYTFWLGVRERVSRGRWLELTRRVPVLMYHAFGDQRGDNRYLLSARSFAWQMRLLALLRYRVIGLEELIGALRGAGPLPTRAVVITIDDGYADNLEVAKPILRRHRFPATIYLVSNRLGLTNDWSEEDSLSGRKLLSGEQIRELGGEGITFGAHTRSHLSLPTASEAAAVEEIAGSRAELESVLGSSVATFAYPYGRLDDQAVTAVERAEFSGACGVDGRSAELGDDPLRIPRIEVRGSDSPARFLRKLLLG